MAIRINGRIGRERYTFATTDAGHLWFCVLIAGGDFNACYRLVPKGGRPVVAELRVVPTAHCDDRRVNIRPDGEPLGDPEPVGDGITAGLLKTGVPITEHIYEVLPAALKKHRDGPLGALYTLTVGALGFEPDKKPQRGRRGPKGWPDEEYARLASAYVERCKAGSRSPVVDVAAAHGMSPDGVRAALHRARGRELLTRQTQGRAGGELTAKAKRLLRQAQKKHTKKGRE